MKVLSDQYLASSHVDKQGEVFPINVLASMVDQANGSYIPFGVEHDPRIRPLGRIRKTRLVPTSDGECAVVGDIEIFDDESLPALDATRKMPLPSLDEARIGYDRSYRDRKNKQIIDEISRALGRKAEEAFKKSLDPVTLLEILGAFVIGNFAGGFLQKMGADAWDKLKLGLKRLARVGPHGQLFSFSFYAEHSTGKTVVEVILTRPSPDDVERFFSHDLPIMYESLKPILDTEGLHKLVLESKRGKFRPLFGLRSDAVPINLDVTKPQSRKRQAKEGNRKQLSVGVKKK